MPLRKKTQEIKKKLAVKAPPLNKPRTRVATSAEKATN